MQGDFLRRLASYTLKGIKQDYALRGINEIYPFKGILTDYTFQGIEEEKETNMADLVRSPLQLGSLIQWERTRQQMSQTQLADLAGTGQKTISQIENGNDGARLETVFRLLAVLGMDVQIIPRGRGKSIGEVF